jgi:hypothetical protein
MQRVRCIPDRSASVQAKLRALPSLPADAFCCPPRDTFAIPAPPPGGRIADAEHADYCPRLRRHRLARYARRRNMKPHRRLN